MTDHNNLMDFVSAVAGDEYVRVEENLGDGFVRLKVSEAERRQAQHDIRSVEDIVVELLRNSRDALARRLFLAVGREGDTRSITVIDDGVGIPATMIDRIFEPRVTSKLETMVIDRWGVHGRGMALFSIRSNTESAQVVASGLHKGAAISITSLVDRLGERADQSTWPKVEKDDSGALHVTRGPHNIIRRTVEFALEHPGVDVFIGSTSEVLSTLVMLARFELDESELLFCDDLLRLPVWQRPGAAADATELTDVSVGLGLPVSERTAHRILAGEITPLRTVQSTLAGASPTQVPAMADIYRDRRGLKIDRTDLAAFSADLEKAFDTIAEKYYLQLKCAPKVTVGKENIRVRFEVDKED